MKWPNYFSWEMNLSHKRLDLIFWISIALTLFFPILFPNFRVYFFLPFLIIAFYQKSLSTCLWLSVGCGTIMDLLSSLPTLGVYALAYTVTTLLLYRIKRNFFADHISTLPLMTLFFSQISSCFLVLETSFLENLHSFSWKWLFSDLAIMPLLDSSFAFCFFIVPALLFGKPIRRGRDYFIEE